MGFYRHADWNLYIGISLALSSTIFIGTSFVITKKSLLQLGKVGGNHARAASGGHGYLKLWLWWLGVSLQALGEILNFVAYAFAPATLVSVIGALSVIISAILAARYLNEKINLLGKIGCCLAIIGSTIVVTHAPRSSDVNSLEQLKESLTKPVVILYILTIIALIIFMVTVVAPRYGSYSIAAYIGLCSLIGSFTVMCTKGVGLALSTTFNHSLHENELEDWMTWTLLIILIVCVVSQVHYFNKALDLFDTALVTTVYYVLFTTCVITTSTFLFQEWQYMSAKDITSNILGFLTCAFAIVLLNLFKNLDITWENLNVIDKPKADEDRFMLKVPIPEKSNLPPSVFDTSSTVYSFNREPAPCIPSSPPRLTLIEESDHDSRELSNNTTSPQHMKSHEHTKFFPIHSNNAFKPYDKMKSSLNGNKAQHSRNQTFDQIQFDLIMGQSDGPTLNLSSSQNHNRVIHSDPPSLGSDSPPHCSTD